MLHNKYTTNSHMLYNKYTTIITCSSSLRNSLQSANNFIGSSVVRSLKSDVLKSFSLISFSFSFESFEKNLTAT